MNITNWNDTEEVVAHIFLVIISFPLHLYVLFLTSAIFDFQDEKPKDQKTPFDVLIKDLMRTLFWLAYILGHIQFISFFTPPLNNDIVYWFSYFMIFINHFTLASILVTVYTPFENPQRWMGQNTFPILLLNDDNMIGEH